MLLLIDAHVPDDIAEVFRARGHDLVLARDEFADGTPDEVLAQWGHEERAVFVTWDRDVRRDFARRYVQGERNRFYNLSRISFAHLAVGHAVRRIENLIDLIEFEYAQVQQLSDRRLLMEITAERYTVYR